MTGYQPNIWQDRAKQIRVSKVKLSPFSRGRPEGSLFNSYYTKVLRKALLVSSDCSTLPLIHTLYCWVLSKEVSSTIFQVFGMTRSEIEPRPPGPLANTLSTWPMSWYVQRYQALLITGKTLYNQNGYYCILSITKPDRIEALIIKWIHNSPKVISLHGDSNPRLHFYLKAWCSTDWAMTHQYLFAYSIVLIISHKRTRKNIQAQVCCVVIIYLFSKLVLEVTQG